VFVCYDEDVIKKPRWARIIHSVYDDLLVQKYKDQNFWILTAFIPTFTIARLLVHYYPHLFFQLSGVHIHHFTYGFILLALSGYLAIVRPRRSPPWLAFMFGVGLALAIDETGMWLHLTNHYYNETSHDALIVGVAVLVNLVYFRHFWFYLAKALIKLVMRRS
jgi:hypothetical protein